MIKRFSAMGSDLLIRRERLLQIDRRSVKSKVDVFLDRRGQ